jgi:hypothetical protein
VLDDLNESSGVSAIRIHLLSFVLPFGFPEKSEGGGGYNRRGEMSTFSTHRVPEAIFFRGNLIMTTIMEMANRRG